MFHDFFENTPDYNYKCIISKMLQHFGHSVLKTSHFFLKNEIIHDFYENRLDFN